MSEYVLDASAVLALIHAEPGAERVEAILQAAVISAVNLAEVASRLADRGMPGDVVRRIFMRLRLPVVPLDEELAYAAGLLRPVTRAAGLSLGDRVCLALAGRLGAIAITADRIWTRIDLGVSIELLRSD